MWLDMKSRIRKDTYSQEYVYQLDANLNVRYIVVVRSFKKKDGSREHYPILILTKTL